MAAQPSSSTVSSWGKMASALPRRVYTLIWIAVFAALALFFLAFSDNAWLPSPSSPERWKIPYITDTGSITGIFKPTKSDPLRVAIYEVGGTHDEVVSALIHSFGGQKNAELSLYLKAQRYNIGDIVANFTLEAPIVARNHSSHFKAAVDTQPPPHIFVSTTCELDLGSISEPLQKLLDGGATYMFCIFHHADRWNNQGSHVKIVRQWAEAGKVDFVALSQHTADFLQKDAIAKWSPKVSPNTRVLPPVFPVQVPGPDLDLGPSLAMQGDYSSGRRDYQGVFEHLGVVSQQVKEASNGKESVSLHVIGHGKTPEVPENVRSQVVFDADLSYPDFYAVMSRAFSIIPAFASDTYFDRKASSSVPAALIAGAPIVASPEMLHAYTYLPKDCVWLSRAGESEMDVIQRVIGDRNEYVKKAGIVKDTRDRLMKDNRENVRGWINSGLEHLNHD